MEKALAPEISTWPDESAQSIVSQCAGRHATAFPRQDRCTRYGGTNMVGLLHPWQGKLVAWTTQGFPPGPPCKGPTGKAFVPFGVGLVQSGELIPVEGRLTENNPVKLGFGQAVEPAIVALATDDSGDETGTFAFGPA